MFHHFGGDFVAGGLLVVGVGAALRSFRRQTAAEPLYDEDVSLLRREIAAIPDRVLRRSTYRRLMLRQNARLLRRIEPFCFVLEPHCSCSACSL